MSPQHHTSYVNGEFIPAGPEDQDLEVLNPSTEEVITTLKLTTEEVVDRAVAAARAAQDPWRRLTQKERARYMVAIADAMQNRHEEFVVDLMTEMGKIRAHAEGEVNKSIDYFRYMAEWARRIEGEVIPSDRPGELIMLQRRPIGVVAGICPWNYPLSLLARKVAPALITGCTTVIKPARDTPLNAILFAEICAEVGLPAGVFNLILGTGALGGTLAGHPGVDFVTFTGSTPTGAKIMESASKSVTKVGLELGGKAPAIVLKDADLELAVERVAQSRLLNNGQVCTCAERVYVERPIADEFIKRMGDLFGALKTGNTADPSVNVGPLVNRKAVEHTRKVLDEAIAAGATLVAGGGQVDGPGFFFPPAVIRVDDPKADILYNEVFGPILPIHIVDDLDEAIERANDCEYGLASSLYTNDLNKTLRVIDELQFGEVYVNRENEEANQGFHAGIKASGIGGADGKHAIEEYTTTQVSYIQRY